MHRPGHNLDTVYDDLGALLRALRRRADFSQRELAERAGLPASTVANIEAGRALDPRFRTIERLVAAAGGTIAITMADGSPVTAAPEDGLRDGGDRRYPAHLDVRPVRTLDDWWGFTARRPRRSYDPHPPEYTFDRNRRIRDLRRRQAAAGTDEEPYLYVRRLGPGDEAVLDALPRGAAVRYLADPAVQHWMVESGSGYRRGHLAAGWHRSARGGVDRLVIHDLWCETPHLDDAGTCLVGAAAGESLSTDPPGVLCAVTDDAATEAFYRRLGFKPRAVQPVWLELPQ